jgi:sugar/nucleoside kinase (ribokinase family)
MYAAGFLYGISSGKSIEIAGKIASLSAAAVVASPGARAEKDIDLSVVL